MGSVHSVGLNQAIVVSGGCTTGERKMVRGGWIWAWWIISDVQVFLCRYVWLASNSTEFTIHTAKLKTNGTFACL